MDFSKNLKELREKNNLTQEEIAQKIKISRQSISNWERGKSYPDLEKIIMIKEIFNITLDELILGDLTLKNKLINDGKHKVFKYIAGVMIGIIIWVLIALVIYFIINYFQIWKIWS